METETPAIEREVESILSLIKSIRHHLHANPELALKEHETSRYIRSRLAEQDIEALPPFLETDVVAIINGKEPGRNVTLRADMDALPLQEATDLPYRSLQPDLMHACGHDGHMAMLIGAAIVLKRMQESFSGSVRLVFQPGEEVVAAGKELVARGALNDPRPDAVLAMHAWGGHPLGVIGSKPGVMMAAADFFRITIKGKGGHGSRPERTIDPILTATRVINSIYAIPSRMIGALEPVVISVCSIHGGQNCNIIPDQVVLEGTLRYLSKTVGEKLPALFEHALKTECEIAGASYNLEYSRTYIPTVNDAGVVAVCKAVAGRFLGASSWTDLGEATMGSEDFSYYIEHHPGAMFFLGMGQDSRQLHNNQFDFNDGALRNGILFFVHATLELLRS